MSTIGTLYLIPTPIAEGDPNRMLAPAVVETIRALRHFVVESERHAERFLSRILDSDALRAITFAVLDEHSRKRDVPTLLEPALEGKDLGLLSEAGCPCVADPGSDLVAEAHRLGVRVVPLPGPSAVLLALMASGFSGQSFRFLGYIPAEREARRTALLQLEKECARDGATRIFIEAPYRNQALLEDALSVLDANTRLCVAASLGGPGENIVSRSVRLWREGSYKLAKEPAIFLISSASLGTAQSPRKAPGHPSVRREAGRRIPTGPAPVSRNRGKPGGRGRSGRAPRAPGA